MQRVYSHAAAGTTTTSYSAIQHSASPSAVRRNTLCCHRHTHARPALRQAFPAQPPSPLHRRSSARRGGILLVSAAQREQDASKKSPGTALGRGKAQGGKPPEEEEQKWGLLDLEAYQKPWDVPWGAKTVVGGMTLWATSFIIVGIVLLPLIGYTFGIEDFTQTTQLDKTYYALLNQILETAVGIGVIGLAVKSSQPFPEDLFRLSFKHPFRKGDGWAVWGGVGILLAPFVVAGTAFLVSALGYPPETAGGSGTVDMVAKIISLNVPTYASLFTVTAILAPLLEETVFRGFLLTSLTKFMPTPAAVVVSASLFGAAHLSARDFPQLTALGIVMGFAYVRSRNLLTPMLIHGLWNGTVLTILFALVQSGVNLEDIL